MAYVATIKDVGLLDNEILVTVEITNGADSVILKQYPLNPGTLVELRNQLKPAVAADLAKFNNKEAQWTTLRGFIGQQVKDL